jgi:predicted nucleic acid-binding protein
VIVADTNLIAYLLIRGQHTGEAEAVYRKDPQWSAPVLWRSEFRNVLVFYLQRGLIGIGEAFDTMEQAERLMRGQEFEVESSRVLRLAAGAAACSAYDCDFVGLAQDLGVPLVTSDSALIARFKPTVVSMRAFCA